MCFTHRSALGPPSGPRLSERPPALRAAHGAPTALRAAHGAPTALRAAHGAFQLLHGTYLIPTRLRLPTPRASDTVWMTSPGSPLDACRLLRRLRPRFPHRGRSLFRARRDVTPQPVVADPRRHTRKNKALDPPRRALVRMGRAQSSEVTREALALRRRVFAA